MAIPFYFEMCNWNFAYFFLSSYCTLNKPCNNKLKDSKKLPRFTSNIFLCGSDWEITANKLDKLFISVGISLVNTNLSANKQMPQWIHEIRNNRKWHASAVTGERIVMCNLQKYCCRMGCFCPRIMKLVRRYKIRPLPHIWNSSYVTDICPEDLKLQTWFKYLNLAMIWCFPIAGLFLYCLYCQKS